MRNPISSLHKFDLNKINEKLLPLESIYFITVQNIFVKTMLHTQTMTHIVTHLKNTKPSSMSYID